MIDLLDIIPDDVPYPISSESYCPYYRNKVNIIVSNENLLHVIQRGDENVAVVSHYCMFCKCSHNFDAKLPHKEERETERVEEHRVLKVSVRNENIYFNEYKWKCPQCGQKYKGYHITSYLFCKRCKNRFPDIWSMIDGEDEDKLEYHRGGTKYD
jgi:protein-arginine kinase activator protein McsA